MSWWDVIVDFGSNVLDFAVSNPTITGAVIGGLADGSRGAVKGAALGHGLGYLSGASGALEAPQLWGGSATGWQAPSTSQSIPTSSVGLAAPGAAQPTFGIAPGVNAGLGFSGSGTLGLAPLTAAPGQASLTGNFGGFTADYSLGGGGTGSMLTAGAPTTLSTGLSNTLDRVSDWGRNNPRLGALAVQGLSALAGNRAQREATAVQREALAMQRGAQTRNDAVADEANVDAERLSDVAWSNYNPEHMAVRAYAQQLAAGARELDDIEQQGMARGRSPATVAAERRRAELDTSRNAKTAWMGGLDTGARMQQGALGQAAQMRHNYSAPGFDAGLHGAMQQRADARQGQITSLLEHYLGNPSEEVRRRQAQARGELVQ